MNIVESCSSSRLLIFYAEFVVIRVILLPEIGTFFGVINFFIFQSLTVLAVASHIRTMLTDPVKLSTCSLGKPWSRG